MKNEPGALDHEEPRGTREESGLDLDPKEC